MKPEQKSKKQLIEEVTGIRKSEITRLLCKTKDNTKASRLKYLLYLHSKTVSKERFEELLDNGNFLVRNWDEIKKMITETNTEDFEEYPILKKYFEMWCNSLLGESMIYRVGNGNLKAGIKYAKKLFIRYELEEFKEVTIGKSEEETPTGGFYEPKFTDEQIKVMRHLAPEGYKGFYCFHIPDNQGKTQFHIIYDNRFIQRAEYTDPQKIPYIIQEIFYKFSLGLIK